VREVLWMRPLVSVARRPAPTEVAAAVGEVALAD
jgi:hypothetical protein